MKIRNGFVSNSSSASFIVTVKMDKHQLCGILYKELGWNYINKPTFIGTLKNNLEEHKEIIENNKKEIEEELLKRKENPLGEKEWDKVHWAKQSSEMWEEVVKREEDLLVKIEKYKIGDYKYDGEEDFINYLIDALSYHHVTLKPLFKTEDVWEFTSWISMFNSYDDIPILLKEIILMFAFENHEVRCKMEGDE